MSVRRAAWIAVGIGIVLVLAFGAFLFHESVGVAKSVGNATSIYGPGARQGALLETSISDMQRGVGNYLLSQDESDLGPYVDGSRRSDLALQELAQLVAPDQLLADTVARVAQDRDLWIDAVARPTIDTTRRGLVDDAVAIYQGPESAAIFNRLQADAATLGAEIDERVVEAFSALTSLTYRLVRTVLIAVVLLWGSLMAGFFIAQRRVLAPLDDLGRQTRSVARSGEHTRTIRGSGPAELRSLGADVEELRRQLVSEVDEARSARQALDQNAPVVAAIQAQLMAGEPVAAPGLQIFGVLHPAQGVIAGDWWDSTMLPTGEVALIVADVSGHGAAAGILAMALKQSIGHDLQAGKDIAAVALSAADVFKSHSDQFATFAAVCVHPGTGHVRYINAGHHEPLVIDDQGRIVESLPRTGPILSWLGGQWEIGTTMLQPGYAVLLYSDGLIESHDAAGEELGEEQLAQWLLELTDDQRSPEAMVRWLIGAGRSRAVDWSRDDVTVVAVRRVDVPPQPKAKKSAGLRRKGGKAG